MNLKTGMRVIPVLFVVLLAFAACASPVSAAWVYKGEINSTDAGTDGTYRLVVQQITKYWYDSDQDLWKEEITVIGEAKYYNSFFETWQSTYGNFGVYHNDIGYLATSETYGDEKVWYTSSVVEDVQIFGYGTVYSGTVYTSSGPSGDAVYVGAAGEIPNYSVGAQCWTGASE